jgi:predicted small integral membrane protein
MTRLPVARTTLVRVCKTALVATIALLMALIALGNLTNYDSNAAFVHHVLAMDTIFPGSHLLWRAITDPLAQTIAYDAIIAWESLSAIVGIVATVRLVRGLGSAERFAAATPLAALGLTMVLVLFGAGFLTIGSEWFLMWQSSTWNGNESASRDFTFAGITLLILLTPDPERTTI